MTHEDFKLYLKTICTGYIDDADDYDFEVTADSESENLENWWKLSDAGFGFPEDGVAEKDGYTVLLSC